MEKLPSIEVWTERTSTPSVAPGPELFALAEGSGRNATEASRAGVFVSPQKTNPETVPNPGGFWLQATLVSAASISIATVDRNMGRMILPPGRRGSDHRLLLLNYLAKPAIGCDVGGKFVEPVCKKS